MLAFSRKLDKELHLIENIDLTIPEEGYTRFFFIRELGLNLKMLKLFR